MSGKPSLGRHLQFRAKLEKNQIKVDEATIKSRKRKKMIKLLSYLNKVPILEIKKRPRIFIKIRITMKASSRKHMPVVHEF